MSLLSFLYNKKFSINLCRQYNGNKFIPTKTWYILRLQTTQNVNNLMSVFLMLGGGRKQERTQQQRGKKCQVLINKASLTNICLLLLYFMSLGRNDVEVAKNCFKKCLLNCRIDRPN